MRERVDLLKRIDELKTMVADLRIEKEAAQRESALVHQANDLKVEIEELKISKARMQEEHDKDERELRHLIGLEKRRQEFEIQQAKRETEVKVREENLTADKARFGEEMKFQRERFEKEVAYLKEMMGDILERLPVVTVDRTIEERRAAKKVSGGE